MELVWNHDNQNYSWNYLQNYKFQNTKSSTVANARNARKTTLCNTGINILTPSLQLFSFFSRATQDADQYREPLPCPVCSNDSARVCAISRENLDLVDFDNECKVRLENCGHYELSKMKIIDWERRILIKFYFVH